MGQPTGCRKFPYTATFGHKHWRGGNRGAVASLHSGPQISSLLDIDAVPLMALSQVGSANNDPQQRLSVDKP
jgi:hypothetical protein